MNIKISLNGYICSTTSYTLDHLKRGIVKDNELKNDYNRYFTTVSVTGNLCPQNTTLVVTIFDQGWPSSVYTGSDLCWQNLTVSFRKEEGLYPGWFVDNYVCK